jgi:DNA-binding Lrp family transcriptional regulator
MPKRIELPLEEIKRLYIEEKLNAKAIAEKLGVSRSTILRRLKKLNVKIRTLSEQITIDFQLKRRIHPKPWLGKKVPKEIAMRRVNRKRGYNARMKVNVDFFKQIGDDQLYVFGRLLTDGSWRLRKTGGEVRLKSIDKENLEKIRFVMDSNYKIRKEKTKNGTWIHILDIYSNEIVRDLQVLEKNKEQFISNPHFLRGLIDGDGGIYLHKNKLRIDLTSSDIEFLKAIQNYWGGTIYTRGKCATLEWNGKNAERVCEAIYGANMPFLCIARKFSRWQLYQAMRKRLAPYVNNLETYF